MQFFRHILLVTLCLLTSLSHAAGFSFIEVPADADGPALRGAVWTPCRSAAAPLLLSPLVISAVKDCPIVDSNLPLVVISHGSGGSFLMHHDTATALADAGFVVASINHPGDNFQDMRQRAHLSSFANRPVDMRRLIDYLLQTWPGRSNLDAQKIGLFGFSRGGYTGLVAVGGVPNWTLRKDLCPEDSNIALCDEIRHHAFPSPPSPDPRIKAAVIVDPLSFFDADGLQQITVPIQLWASANGGDGVTLASVETIRHALKAPPDWHVVKNAGHFAFLAPCPPALIRDAPELCRDAEGFNRSAFHQEFNTAVTHFFEQTLTAPAIH